MIEAEPTRAAAEQTTPRPGGTTDVIVCHCRVVSDREIAASVRGGARSLAGICRSTGAGQDCGACVFSVRRLLCEHESSSRSAFAVAGQALPEVDVAAS